MATENGHQIVLFGESEGRVQHRVNWGRKKIRGAGGGMREKTSQNKQRFRETGNPGTVSEMLPGGDCPSPTPKPSARIGIILLEHVKGQVTPNISVSQDTPATNIWVQHRGSESGFWKQQNWV